VLYSFTGGSDGASPAVGLIFDAAGNLYGTMSGSPYAPSIELGYVFKLSGPGTPLSENPQTADFSANGKSDILWQNTGGQAAIWLMNGSTPTAESAVEPNPGPGWQVIGIGNFYGSLNSGILWQNTDGTVAIWEMNGTNVVAYPVAGNPGPS
jgi:hypothetical protein